MDRLSATVIAALAAFASAACGDPLVVLGDSPGTLRIVAGVPNSAGDQLGDYAVETLLREPRGVAGGASGTWLIADYGNGRVLAVTSSGAVEVLVDGRQQGGEPRLHNPDGLFLDGDGQLLIADPVGHRLWQVKLKSGDLWPIAGTGLRGSSADGVEALLADLDMPTGVVRISDGRVCFSESGRHRVRCIASDGTLVTLAGDGVAGSLGDGGPARSARLRRPAGITEADGVLYIADSGNHRIRAVDLETSVIGTVAGLGVPGFGGDDGPATESLLDTPLGVAVSTEGNSLFIADSQNHRLRIVNLDSRRISTFAGTGDQAFNGDLLAAGVTALNRPQATTVSAAGFLYISDTDHHIVRRTALAFLAAR